MNTVYNRLKLTLKLALYDFKSKYAGSVFGTLWAIAEPLVTVVIYWFVYTIAFGGKSINEIPYYIWLSTGIVPWFFVCDSLRQMTTAFFDYSFLVKKMSFDKSVILGVRLISALFSHLIFLLLVLTICALSGLATARAFIVIPIIILNTIFSFSLGSIFSLVCSRFKDTANIVSIILSILFWITPIFWSADNLSQNIRTLIMLNPVAIIVDGYRNAVLYGKFIEPNHLAYMIFVCLVLNIGSHWCKKLLLPNIADNI